MAKKLSQNFSLRELTKEPWDQISPPKRFLLTNLATKVLQPVRNVLKTSITITSGVRTIDDYHRLIKRGYNPSETSDHFYGASVLLRSARKQKLYGKRYNFGSGAADMVPRGDVYAAFRKLIPLVKSGKLRVGQMIYERQGTREWIHISNPYSLVYSAEFVKLFLKKTKLLKSVDGGRSYQLVK